MNDFIAAAIGLITGATMAVVTSCVWAVLLIPARVQDVFRAGSPCSLTWAICLGLMLSTLNNALGFCLPLPAWCGSAGLLLGGMFVGMLASALGEILEVAPVLMRRFRLGDVSAGVRFTMMLSKGLGAILAALAFTA